MNKPLEGLKVIEMATYVAAPTCARLLGDWGAEVIKIESPIGDPLRRAGYNTKMTAEPEENPCFDLSNMSKKGLVLNLKTESGLEIINKLLADCDVFITNTRSKSLEKLGLSYEQLKEKYPKLIVAQVCGYGEKGPLKDRPGFDFTSFYARGGLLGTLCEKDTSPLNPVPSFGDNQVALGMAGGILAALYKRAKTGVGDKVTVSLYSFAMFALNLAISSSQYGFSYPVSRKEVVNPLLNTYKTKDNRWLQIAAPEYDRIFPIAMKAIGREDLIDNESYNKVRNIQSTQVIEMIEKEMIKRNVDEWVEIFDSHDIPCEKAFLWNEILEDQQAWENEYLHEMKYKTGNVRTLVDTPVKFGSLGSPQHKRGPLPGEHSHEILKSLNYTVEQIEQLKEEGAINKG